MLSESGLAEIANDPPLSAKEKKRSQNRVAQRVYRRNQKLKMQALEQAVAQTAARYNAVSLRSPASAASPEPVDPPKWNTARHCSPTQENQTFFDAVQLNQTFDVPWDDISLHQITTQATDLSRPALHRAISRGDKAMCAVLLQNGANTTRLDGSGKTVIDLAVEAGDTNVLRVMLENGSDPNVKNCRGRTALFTAVEAKNAAMAKLLLDYRVDVNSFDQSGEVALHVAVDMGSEAMTRLLLQYGADIDA